MRRPPASSAGFTIIELMVTIAVLAVLLTVGVPAFNDMIRNNRIANQTNAVVGALNYARSEAATRSIPVSICAANAQHDGCAAVTTWANGWIIFTDRNGTAGVIDAGDEILQDGGVTTTGFSVVGSASFIRFGLGATGTTASTFTIRPVESSVCATTGQRQIAISNIGRVSTVKRTCS